MTLKNIRKRFETIFQKITFGDKLLIVILISTAIISFIGARVYSISNQSEEKVVTVKQDEKTLLQISIKNEKDNGIYYFDFDKGIGAIEVKNNKVRMLPMEKSICPEEICSDTGWIDGILISLIVCLPNRLIANINTSEEPIIDGIVY